MPKLASEPSRERVQYVYYCHIDIWCSDGMEPGVHRNGTRNE